MQTIKGKTKYQHLKNMKLMLIKLNMKRKIKIHLQLAINYK